MTMHRTDPVYCEGDGTAFQRSYAKHVIKRLEKKYLFEKKLMFLLK